MLIVFRFPEGAKVPQPGDLVAIDPELGPVQLYLTKEDRRGVEKMPATASSIVCFPDGMAKETADALLRMHVPRGERKITHLFPQKGDPHGPDL